MLSACTGDVHFAWPEDRSSPIKSYVRLHGRMSRRLWHSSSFPKVIFCIQDTEDTAAQMPGCQVHTGIGATWLHPAMTSANSASVQAAASVQVTVLLDQGIRKRAAQSGALQCIFCTILSSMCRFTPVPLPVIDSHLISLFSYNAACWQHVMASCTAMPYKLAL